MIALVGIGERAALAPAALLSRAGLVVDQHRNALDLAQFALDRVEVVAVMDGRAGGEASVVFVRLVADHRDPLDAFRPHLIGDVVDRKPTLCGWPPVIATASL